MSSQTTTPPLITRSHLFAVVFFSAFLWLAYQLLLFLAPFAFALVWAAVIAIALSPLHRVALKLARGRASIAAAAMTVCTLLVVIIPSLILLTILAEQAVELYRWASAQVLSGAFTDAWSRLAAPLIDRILEQPLLARIDIKGLAIKGFSDIASGLAGQIGTVLKNTVLLVFNMVIMLFTLFFLFRDGESYYAWLMGLLPFSREQQHTISRKALDTFRAVINGLFLVALLQGVMTAVGLALFGVPFPVFWGFLATGMALLPVGGAAIVWLPAALYLYAADTTLHSLLLAAWGVVFVSLPDNFLKPMLIGKKTKLPTFLLSISILGGISVYGFLGILIGPIVVALLTVFVQIYREEYGDK